MARETILEENGYCFLFLPITDESFNADEKIKTKSPTWPN